MYKHSSQILQERNRRLVEHSRKNTAGIDSQVFADGEKLKLESRSRILGQQITDIENKLARLKAMIEEASLRRGTFGSRSISPTVEAKWQQEKRLLLGELNAARSEKSKIRSALASHPGEKPLSFEETFHALAKEMLAGPVYDRIAFAAVHRIGERKEENR